MTEAQHQAMVMKWSQQPEIRSRWPELALLYHIPNSGTRDAIEGRHLKQQGVKRGVPDLCLPVARENYHPSDINWEKFGRDAVAACGEMGMEYYIKDSLRTEMDKQ